MLQRTTTQVIRKVGCYSTATLKFFHVMFLLWTFLFFCFENDLKNKLETVVKISLARRSIEMTWEYSKKAHEERSSTFLFNVCIELYIKVRLFTLDTLYDIVQVAKVREEILSTLKSHDSA